MIDTAGEGTVLDEAANRLQESLAMIHVAGAGLRRLEGRLQGEAQLTTESVQSNGAEVIGRRGIWMQLVAVVTIVAAMWAMAIGLVMVTPATLAQQQQLSFCEGSGEEAQVASEIGVLYPLE